MSRRRHRRLSVFGPLVIGLLLVLVGRLMRAHGETAAAAGPPAMTLPRPRAASTLAAGADLPLVPSACSIRVQARDTLHVYLARGTTARGHLRCDASGMPSELEFAVPLAGLEPLGDADADELRQAIVVALGARNDDDLHFVGRALRVCKVPYDGLAAVTWTGRLRLGHRESHVELEFWLAMPTQQTARLQTVVGIDPIAFRLPANCCVGPFRERSAVEFGLDLAFRAAGR